MCTAVGEVCFLLTFFFGAEGSRLLPSFFSGFALLQSSRASWEDLPTLLEVGVNLVARVLTFGTSLFLSLSKYAVVDPSEERSDSPIDPLDVLHGLQAQRGQVLSGLYEWLGFSKTRPGSPRHEESLEIVEQKHRSPFQHRRVDASAAPSGGRRSMLGRSLADVSCPSDTEQEEKADLRVLKGSARRRRMQRKLADEEEEGQEDPYTSSSSSNDSLDDSASLPATTTGKGRLSPVVIDVVEDVLELALWAVRTAGDVLRRVLVLLGRVLFLALKPSSEFFFFVMKEWKDELKKRKKSSSRTSPADPSTGAHGETLLGIDLNLPVDDEEGAGSLWHFIAWTVRRLLRSLRPGSLIRELFKAKKTVSRLAKLCTPCPSLPGGQPSAPKITDSPWRKKAQTSRQIGGQPPMRRWT